MFSSSLRLFHNLSDSFGFCRIFSEFGRILSYFFVFSHVFFSRILSESRILSNSLGSSQNFLGFYPILMEFDRNLVFFRISDFLYSLIIFRFLSRFLVFSRFISEFLEFFRILSYSLISFRIVSHFFVYMWIHSEFLGFFQILLDLPRICSDCLPSSQNLIGFSSIFSYSVMFSDSLGFFRLLSDYF